MFLADVDHRPPFRKSRAALVILRQPLGELVEAGGHEFARASGQGLRALVDLDAGNHADCSISLTSGVPSFAFCQMVSVIEDDTGDVFAHRFRGAEQHLAVVAAVLLGQFDADRIEPLLE